MAEMTEADRHYQLLLGQGLQIMIQVEGQPEEWKKGSYGSSRIKRCLNEYYDGAKAIAEYLMAEKF